MFIVEQVMLHIVVFISLTFLSRLIDVGTFKDTYSSGVKLSWFISSFGGKEDTKELKENALIFR